MTKEQVKDLAYRLEELQGEINDLHTKDESPEFERIIESAYKGLNSVIRDIESLI